MTSPKSKMFSIISMRHLRLWLVLFFLAIAIPAALLIQHTYSQLKWEAFHQQRLLAAELTERIELRFAAIINTEQARPFTDYVFLNVAGEPKANFLQRSPISEFPVATSIPGLIGYFQVDPAGEFSTPLIPADLANIGAYGISEAELLNRKTLQQQIYQILNQNQLLDEPTGHTAERLVEEKEESFTDRNRESEALSPAALVESDAVSTAESLTTSRKKAKKDKSKKSQAAFDQLEQSSPKEIGSSSKTLGQSAAPPPAAEKPARTNIAISKTRKEISSLPVIDSVQEVADSEELRQAKPATTESASMVNTPRQQQLTVRTFESEIDPLVFSRLDSGHFVLFRKVWRNGQRIIQGLIIEPTAFLNSVVNSTFQQTGLSSSSNLLLAYRGETISVYNGQAARGYLPENRNPSEFKDQILYQTRLGEPFAELELLFTINNLPPGPGVKVVILQSVILILVLTAGFYLMYRLAARQILIARQQQDFVSAVSHELKTPLTSIRMYGEILKQGWASDDKKNEYYNYIFDESERLSRLINNILQLARMSRQEQQAQLSRNSISELTALLESKVSSQIERAGFKLNLHCTAIGELDIDVDWFTQIILNLVDNAIKFSAEAENKTIDISCHQLQSNKILFSIRDYGPGIKKDQMKLIFKLFYRSENEVTRETVGTGIGLALVHQMTQAMGGQIDVVNKKPGVEFRLTFPEVESLFPR